MCVMLLRSNAALHMLHMLPSAHHVCRVWSICFLRAELCDSLNSCELKLLKSCQDFLFTDILLFIQQTATVCVSIQVFIPSDFFATS